MTRHRPGAAHVPPNISELTAPLPGWMAAEAAKAEAQAADAAEEAARAAKAKGSPHPEAPMGSDVHENTRRHMFEAAFGDDSATAEAGREGVFKAR